MSCDEALAERVGAALTKTKDITQKKMFGGIAFMWADRMFVGISKDQLMVRVGPERHEEALRKRGARPMDFTGRPMKGYLFVAPRELKSRAALDGWIQLALEFVRTLGPKDSRKRPGKPRPASKRTSPSSR